MRIINKSKFPTEIVEKLVRFGVGEFHQKLRVEVLPYRGKRAYRGFCHFGLVLGGKDKLRLRKRATRTAEVKINSDTRKFPTFTRAWAFLSKVSVRNWMEAMVEVAAHEAFHHFQMENGLHLSEMYATRYAVKRLLLWRADPWCMENEPKIRFGKVALSGKGQER